MRLFVAPVSFLLWACSTALGNPPLTGNVPAGTLTYHGDLVIQDVRIVPGPYGERTLTIKVYNGNIDVLPGPVTGMGVDGSGDDGVNGVDGGPPTAGTAAGEAFNLVLETWPTGTGTTPSPCNITIAGPIDVSGGNGGHGAKGNDGYFDKDCNYFDAYSGSTGKPGTDGGSVTIRSSGDIWVTRGIIADGGNGGNGGSAGYGIMGPAGYSQPGRDGGNGGSILLEHTAFAPTTAMCVIYSSATMTAGLYAQGGTGGNGGHGASGYSAAHPGSNAGHGGAGGSITIATRNLWVSAATEGGTRVSTIGGLGGVGGAGGDGLPGNCNGCFNVKPPFEFSQPGSSGADSGAGGRGGDGGPITVTVNDDISMGPCSAFFASGGNGNIAGRGGQGGVAGPSCTNFNCGTFTALLAGATRSSGSGGDAGVISLTGKSINVSAPTVDCAGGLWAVGGDGAPGRNSSPSGRFCCGGQPVAASGVQGGAAGGGGNGNNIDLTYTSSLSAAANSLNVCGGRGAAGGKGGSGSPAGSGGLGSADGVHGKVYKNGTPQPDTCLINLNPNGPTGDGPGTCGGS